MAKWFKYLELPLLLLVAVFFLLHPQSMAAGTVKGLQICAAAILPALFPFFVLTNVWIARGYTDRLAKLTAPLMCRYFHLSGSASAAFILGSIGGYPVGAVTVAQLYHDGRLSKLQAEETLRICNNSGPAFIIGVVGVGVFSSFKVGVILYLIHLIASLLTGFIFRPADRPTDSTHLSIPIPKQSSAELWTQSIRTAGSTALQVCIFVLFFAILTEAITDAAPDVLANSRFFPLLTGALELAGGCRSLSAAPWSPVFKISAAAFFLGFGGLCVLLQSLSILQQAGLSARRMIQGKIYQGIFSAVLAACAARFLPIPLSCSSQTGPFFLPAAQNLVLILCLLLFSGLFLKESTGKVEKHRI